MNILSLDNHLLSEFVKYLSIDEMYSFVETCKTFYFLVRNFLQIEIKQPSIYHIVGSIQLIEWAKKHPNFKYCANYTKFAVKRNEIDILKYLIKDGCNIDCRASYVAVQNDNFEILKYCVKKNIYSDSTLNVAASENNVKMMKYLIKKNCDFDHVTCNYAANSGSYEALKFLIENNCCLNYDIYDCAVMGGNLKLLKYLFRYTACDLSKPHFTQNTMQIAVNKGFFNIVRWLTSKKCYMDHYSTYTAAKNNDIECLKYLIDNKCPIKNNLFLNLRNFGLNYNIQDATIV